MTTWKKRWGIVWGVCCLAGVASNPAQADFGCSTESGLTVCQPEAETSPDLKDRLEQSRLLFERDDCLVIKQSISGQAEWIARGYPYEIRLSIGYECRFQPRSSDGVGKRRIKQSSTAIYDFACSRREFKYFESGFDFFGDDTRMHWDSQGSSRPIPWQGIIIGARNPRLMPLFKVWCESRSESIRMG